MTAVFSHTPEQLQQEIARLLALVGQHESTIKQQESSIQNLQHQLHLFRTARFGRKSEKGVVPEQLSLRFDEAELTPEVEAPVTSEAAQTETIT